MKKKIGFSLLVVALVSIWFDMYQWHNDGRCEELREKTGKPYEYFEAALLGGAGLNMPTHGGGGALVGSQGANEPALLSTPLHAGYQNRKLGKFSVYFIERSTTRLEYTKIMYDKSRPIHSFCAYKVPPKTVPAQYFGDFDSIRILGR